MRKLKKIRSALWLALLFTASLLVSLKVHSGPPKGYLKWDKIEKHDGFNAAKHNPNAFSFEVSTKRTGELWYSPDIRKMLPPKYSSYFEQDIRQDYINALIDREAGRGPPTIVAGPPIGIRIAAPKLAVSSGTTLFLDESGLGSADAAFSVARKLRSAYSGSAIRVRRSSDSTEQDIGFVSNELDTSTLATFCSGTDGFVVTIYDQSGNGRNLTQSTAANQPQIVSSGTILTAANSKPCARFDGSNDNMTTGSFTLSNPLTHFMVTKQISWTNGRRLLDGRTVNEGNIQQSGSSPDLRYFDGATGTTANSGAAVGSSALLCAIANGASSSFSVNAGADSTANLGTTTSGGITLSCTAGFLSFGNQDFQELVSYASDKSSNRTTARSNINAFYTLY